MSQRRQGRVQQSLDPGDPPPPARRRRPSPSSPPTPGLWAMPPKAQSAPAIHRPSGHRAGDAAAAGHHQPLRCRCTGTSVSLMPGLSKKPTSRRARRIEASIAPIPGAGSTIYWWSLVVRFDYFLADRYLQIATTPSTRQGRPLRALVPALSEISVSGLCVPPLFLYLPMPGDADTLPAAGRLAGRCAPDDHGIPACCGVSSCPFIVLSCWCWKF